VRSLGTEMELAVMLFPTCVMYRDVAAKKAAALSPWPDSSHFEMVSRGFHKSSPQITPVADVATIPVTAQRVKLSGKKSN